MEAPRGAQNLPEAPLQDVSEPPGPKSSDPASLAEHGPADRSTLAHDV